MTGKRKFLLTIVLAIMGAISIGACLFCVKYPPVRKVVTSNPAQKIQTPAKIQEIKNNPVAVSPVVVPAKSPVAPDVAIPKLAPAKKNVLAPDT